MEISVNKSIRMRLFRLYYRVQALRKMSGTGARECPICGYVGRFRAFGYPPRYNAQCRRCGSLERHRLFYLALGRLHLLSGSGKVLHFAPEACFTKKIEQSCATYWTADYQPGRASMVLNIEKIDLPDNSVDVVIANHVLEHVDDRTALREIHRILTDHGRLITSVPIIEGWRKTYEDPSITSAADRELHFGQSDHIRYYGHDFRERVVSAGFSLDEFTCDGADVVKYGLYRGDYIFIGTKVSGTP